ncbi:MAG: hypothetical protein ACD_39C01409G0003 [uncultured bacterium]|nr:MAG: hypothetical protein ACD_39C01409G0003 [uncultured bacterium]
MKFQRIIICLLICCIYLTGQAWSALYAIPMTSDVSSDMAAGIVSDYRKAGDFDMSATTIFDFLNSARPRSDYLHFLRLIGLPLPADEAAVFETLCLDKSAEEYYSDVLQTGHSLAVFGNNDDSTRIEIIFLSPEELAVYKEAVDQKHKTGKPVANFLTPDLEGRLCGYAISRKAFLAGTHMNFSQFAKEKLHDKK